MVQAFSNKIANRHIHGKYHTGRGTPVHDAYFGQGTGRILFIQCQETESRLSDCHNDVIYSNWNNHKNYCYHSEDAGVVCRGEQLNI